MSTGQVPVTVDHWARGARPVEASVCHCELDDWDFDPRYTEGVCPICGWQPEGAPPAPQWLLLSRRVPWDVVLLLVVLFVAVFLGMIVAQAAGLIPAGRLHLQLPAPLHLRR